MSSHLISTQTCLMRSFEADIILNLGPVRSFSMNPALFLRPSLRVPAVGQVAPTALKALMSRNHGVYKQPMGRFSLLRSRGVVTQKVLTSTFFFILTHSNFLCANGFAKVKKVGLFCETFSYHTGFLESHACRPGLKTRQRQSDKAFGHPSS